MFATLTCTAGVIELLEVVRRKCEQCDLWKDWFRDLSWRKKKEKDRCGNERQLLSLGLYSRDITLAVVSSRHWRVALLGAFAFLDNLSVNANGRRGVLFLRSFEGFVSWRF